MIVPRGGETIFAAAILNLCAQIVGENWFTRAARRIFLSATAKIDPLLYLAALKNVLKRQVAHCCAI
jgi:hypothetical protein